MEPAKPRYSVWDLLFVLFIAGLTGFVAFNRLAVQDWWYFRSYQASPDIVALADEAGLSPVGRRLLYRTDPRLVDRATVEQACALENLGCITESNKVYILNDPARRDEMIVTAAHEMLHMAYRRLSRAEREELQSLLDLQRSQMRDRRLEQRLDSLADADERWDELHSYLGTEYGDLLPALETHYRTYFDDRTKTVAAYRQGETP